jgi:hypothetical protein
VCILKPLIGSKTNQGKSTYENTRIQEYRWTKPISLGAKRSAMAGTAGNIRISPTVIITIAVTNPPYA